MQFHSRKCNTTIFWWVVTIHGWAAGPTTSSLESMRYHRHRTLTGACPNSDLSSSLGLALSGEPWGEQEISIYTASTAPGKDDGFNIEYRYPTSECPYESRTQAQPPSSDAILKFIQETTLPSKEKRRKLSVDKAEVERLLTVLYHESEQTGDRKSKQESEGHQGDESD